MEIEVATGGVGSREGFNLTYDEMIVRLTIAMFSDNSRQLLASRFNGYNISSEELRKCCHRQTTFLASIQNIGRKKKKA